MQVRRYDMADAEACAQVFHVAVQVGAASAYSQQQRDAWSPHVPSVEIWAERLDGLTTWVAVDPGVIGFASVRGDGYVDLLFVHPQHQGRGVAKALYDPIEDWCHAHQVPRMTTAASHLAKPYFERQGWTVERANTVTKGAVTLDNWLMFKMLNGPVVQG